MDPALLRFVNANSEMTMGVAGGSTAAASEPDTACHQLVRPAISDFNCGTAQEHGWTEGQEGEYGDLVRSCCQVRGIAYEAISVG